MEAYGISIRTETALETSVFYGHLARLVAREDFIESQFRFHNYIITPKYMVSYSGLQ
jgi:hypothetical protein